MSKNSKSGDRYIISLRVTLAQGILAKVRKSSFCATIRNQVNEVVRTLIWKKYIYLIQFIIECFWEYKLNELKLCKKCTYFISVLFTNTSKYRVFQVKNNLFQKVPIFFTKSKFYVKLILAWHIPNLYYDVKLIGQLEP